MSIFDVIKYPISEPPTAEELDNLSSDLREFFLELFHYHIFPTDMNATNNWDPKRICNTLDILNGSNPPMYPELVLEVRRHIAKL